MTKFFHGVTNRDVVAANWVKWLDGKYSQDPRNTPSYDINAAKANYVENAVQNREQRRARRQNEIEE